MSRRDDAITLRQMLDHIEEAIALAKVRTRADLESDRMFLLALLKLVEIAGEAATRVPTAMQIRHPEFPWRELIGTRNRLIHGYDAVDLDILWNIVTDDFPSLTTQIETILQDHRG